MTTELKRDLEAASPAPDAKKAKVEVDLAEVRKQVEYYFSDMNLSKDRFFHTKISANEEGWLDMECILSCKKIMALKASREHIVSALAESPLETKAEGDVAFVRRTDALPKLDTSGARPQFGNKDTSKAHNGGVVFQVSNVPADKKWGDVKDVLKVLLPENQKVVFSTRITEETQSCVMLLSPFEDDIAFVEKLTGTKLADNELKIEVCHGDQLKKALQNMPKHVIKKRMANAAIRQKQKQKPIFLGESKFASVTVLRAKVREIMNSRQDGQQLKPGSPDFVLVKSVLEFHPRAAEKLKGMVGIKIDQHTKGDGKSRCCWIVREDGEAEDISMVKCLMSLEANPPAAPAKAEEAKPEEKAAEEKPAEEKAEEAKPEEKVAEEKPAEEKAEEAKPAEEAKADEPMAEAEAPKADN